MNQLLPTKKHLLAVLLEDYFHVGAFDQLIQREQWSRFEARFEHNTISALDLLDRFAAKVTFFSLGWIAERKPDLIREIIRRGHEVACYSTLDLAEASPDQFREEIRRAKNSLENAAGTKVLGFRSAQRWQMDKSDWALEILAQEGFAYDTSIVPTGGDLSKNPAHRFAHEMEFGQNKLWEFPVPTWKMLGSTIPLAGGNFFRQFPHTLIKQSVQSWHESYQAPFVMYFHVWELDRSQPRINSATSLNKIRHYRNLGKMYWVIEDYLKKYNFTPFAEHLKLNTALASDFAFTKPIARPAIKINLAEPPKIPVSIVIPCFNEELSLPYLANTLQSVQESLADKYSPQFIFVDDCSTDQTWDVLHQHFGEQPNFSLVKHPKNRGVAAAIMTGIRAAKTEIVCSMDCDCTYDPHELNNMIPFLKDDVALVTASPYHSEGKVLNVPAWRLVLSKGSSFLYRQVLQQKLATYTSCFRVYRRSEVENLKLEEDGFLGVAELLGRLDLRGAKVVEFPATLAVRLFGYSKMKLAKTMFGHLKLLSKLLRMRLLKRDDLINESAQKLTIPDVTIK